MPDRTLFTLLANTLRITALQFFDYFLNIIPNILQYQIQPMVTLVFMTAPEEPISYIKQKL